MSLVSVVLSGKGGVGKSTTTVGLGRALATKNNKVLLIDCDAGLRSIDKMTGTEKNLIFDMSDAVLGNCDVLEATYNVPSNKNLYVMPAPLSGEKLPTESQMKQLVSLLRSHFDHIIIDSPAGIGTGFKIGISAADQALTVCTPDPVCVDSAFIVHNILSEKNLPHKLIINKFNYKFFNKAGFYKNLDFIINKTFTPLLGLVPEDYDLAAKFLKGELAPNSSKAMFAFHRISERINGENIPINFNQLY